MDANPGEKKEVFLFNWTSMTLQLFISRSLLVKIMHIIFKLSRKVKRIKTCGNIIVMYLASTEGDDKG